MLHNILEYDPPPRNCLYEFISFLLINFHIQRFPGQETGLENDSESIRQAWRSVIDLADIQSGYRDASCRNKSGRLQVALEAPLEDRWIFRSPVQPEFLTSL